MGLSFYTCHNCGGTSINSCVECNEMCGIHWCSEECAEEEGWNPEGGFDPSPEFADDPYYTNCNYCRCEVAEDYELLNYALNKLGLTREELQLKYFKKDEANVVTS